ncbi:DUF3108 domain-containing protein [Aurantibacillus circumpalustris]|uniref:DUF3108 domain-containing protein n=1 Tax=Aurantibacillus circumpalustris TaxID=3036359 RepID=UPI00295ACDD4|nr:DUF3108 domain-containing protein [Aurantibacillus circumpalustris]
MKHKVILLLSFFILARPALHSQTSCVTKNNAFASGEELHYKVIYNWGLIWLESAYASFKVSSSKINDKHVYSFTGSGSTYPKYDWFYKVRDVFEAQVDSESFRPIKFHADISEGSKKDKHTYIFDNAHKKAYTFINHGKKPVKIDTVKTNACTIDVLTAIYYARNIDYSHCKANDTISISLLLDGVVYAIYVRYLGKEQFTSKELGVYNCIKFSPLLVEGSIFKKGEGMTVWVSNDKNKIPIYIETPITVGTIKVKLMSYKGLRNAEDAKIQEPVLPDLKKK